MIEELLAQLLPRRPLSTAAKFAWIAFFALVPLAYVGGSMLEERSVGRSTAVFSIDRPTAIATARQFLVDHGIDAAAWGAYARVDPSDNLLSYFRLHRDAAATAAQSFSLPVSELVMLTAPGGEYAEIRLDGAGRIVGYNLTRLKSVTSTAAVSDAAAEAAARQALAKIPNLTTMLPLGKPQSGSLDRIGAPAVKTNAGGVQVSATGSAPVAGPQCRSFTWNPSTAALPGLKYNIMSAVCGTTPVRVSVTAVIEDSYAEAHWLRSGRPLKILLVIYGCYIAVVVVYAFYRYARRSFEREVSHGRTLLVGGLISAGLILNFITAIDEYVFGVVQGGQGVLWYPLAAVGLFFSVVGFGVATAYGAGEGDLREYYPGKLTSLDALLRGKLFSRNVARAALFGAAFAGWMLLAEGAADWIVRAETGSFSSDLMKLPFFRYPAIAIFGSQAIFVALIPASGLLLPLGFIGRTIRRPHLRKALTVLFAVLACLLGVSKYGSVATGLAGIAILAAMLLGTFFGMDLLAAAVGIAVFEVATSLSRLTALSSTWLQLSVGLGLAGACVLAIELRAVVHGREYRDEEVRPRYARHIEERQLLQAEMAAAREAQLHLLPKAPPEMEGLAISASCIPARVVGGDFYDFFPLDRNRLGIFIAEGSNRGVGSALNIALAKGFLMHTVRRNLPPREVILRLQAAIGPLLEGSGAATYVAYAIVDTAAGTVRYARTGDYPRVLAPSAVNAEQKTELPGSAVPLYEGTANLRAGDSLLLFTDGIARRVRISGRNAVEAVERALARKHREHELEDDLTAVVVRITGVAAVEGVA